jgi:hypothetical protein
MLWNTKNEIPIGSGNRKRKSMGATPTSRCRVDKQELVFKERQEREIEGDPDRQP